MSVTHTETQREVIGDLCLEGLFFIPFWSVSIDGGCYVNGNFVSIPYILPICEIPKTRYFLPKLSCRFSETEGRSESIHPSCACLSMYLFLCPALHP